MSRRTRSVYIIHRVQPCKGLLTRQAARRAGAPVESTPAKSVSLSRSAQDQVGTFWDMLAVRLVFVAVCVAAGYHFRPFSLSKEIAALAGFLFAIAVILFEVRLRRASLRRLIGAAIGSIWAFSAPI